MVFIIDDSKFKREQITDFLEEKRIKFKTEMYVIPALKYIFENKEQISGIILDMGLQSAEFIFDYSLARGLDVIQELERKGIDIPILINSGKQVEVSEYQFVYGQRLKIDDYKVLEDFINFLKQREKQ